MYSKEFHERPNLEIEEERLNELFSTIKPVIRVGDENKLFYIEDVHLRNNSFLWSPKATIEAAGLVPFKVIKTFHVFSTAVLFKPSIAEVLAQIPQKYVNKCVAFETSDNVSIDSKTSCHIADTTLYMIAK